VGYNVVPSTRTMELVVMLLTRDVMAMCNSALPCSAHCPDDTTIYVADLLRQRLDALLRRETLVADC
jgi:hypothetical protein